MRNLNTNTGISPVIGVILVVSITVILAAVIGTLVLGIGQQSTTQNSNNVGIDYSENNGQITAQIITGQAEQVELQVDGTTVDTLNNPSPGDTLTTTNVPEGSDVTIVSTTDDSKQIVQSRTVSSGSGTSETTISNTVTGVIKVNPVIEGATVTSLDTDGSTIATTTTNSNGEYTIETVENGDIEVLVSGVNVSDGNTRYDSFYAGTVQSVPSDGELNVDFDYVSENTAKVNGKQIDVGYTEQDGVKQIFTVEQLQGINENPNSDYKLMRDINASVTTSWNDNKGFNPIQSFRGNIDGQGYTIDNLYINRPSTYDVGFIGFNEGEVSNLVVTNVDITGNNFVGGLIGSNAGDVSNSTLSGDVVSDAGFEVGGLIGLNLGGGTVSNSTSSGTVSGDDKVGGLVGYNFGGDVSNSTSSGDVTGKNDVGGLIGSNDGTVSNSTSSGTVSGDERVGGLVGYNFGGDVSNSTSSGDVSGDTTVGGFIGFNEGTVSNSTSSGDVSGNSNVRGFIASNVFGEISNSTSSGNVTQYSDDFF